MKSTLHRPTAGVDVHKYMHVSAILDSHSNVLGHTTFDNKVENFDKFVKDVINISKSQEPIFALEDTGSNGKALATYLFNKGYEVWSVPPIYTEKLRKQSTHKDKNDKEDAIRVAQSAILHKGSGKLPQFIISEEIENLQDIKGLVADRGKVVKQSTSLKNELHKLLFEKFGSEYRKEIAYKDIYCKRALLNWLDKFEHKEDLLSFRIKYKLQSLQSLVGITSKLEKKLKEVSKEDKSIQLLETIHGCGINTAAKIAGEIAGIEKFANSDKLARYAGIAPREYGSAGKNRHHSDKGGNRILNHAFFELSLAQISRHGPEISKKYYNKKLKEGKSKLHAMRCLRRQLVKVVFQMLSKGESFDSSLYGEEGIK